MYIFFVGWSSTNTLLCMIRYVTCVMSVMSVKNKPNIGQPMCFGSCKLGTKKYCKAELVQRRACFVYLQSSLHKNVIFSVCAHMGKAVYIIFIMWNSISGLEPWYHSRFNISCGVAVEVRSHQKNFK